jgi:hypothetical protein
MTAALAEAPGMAELATSLGKPARGGGRPTAYKTKDGKKVPGCTTIINRFKDSGGIIHWAYECGVAGIDYRKARDAAADVGHYAHALVEATIHGTEFPAAPEGMSAEDVARGQSALAAFVEWRDQVKLEIIDTEIPAVSELWRFGGTRDAIAKVNGTLMLFDWKSSGAVYRDYIVQVAAYRQLAREQGLGVDAAGLVRFGKTHADFTFHHWPSSVLDIGWEFFRYAREMYDLDQQLKSVCK